MITSVSCIPNGCLSRSPYSVYDQTDEPDKTETKSIKKTELKAASKRSEVDDENKLSRTAADEAVDTDEEGDVDMDKEEYLVKTLFPVHKSDLLAKKDPYLNNVSDSEDEDVREILPTDFPIIATTAEQDAATLEMYIYDSEEGGLFVHHDFIIPEGPLCTEYMYDDDKGVSFRNLFAIGFVDSSIQFWDLDCYDQLDSVLSLPALPNPKPLKKKSAKKPSSSNLDSKHTGAVLALHKCPQSSNILASGSADQSVKIWNVHKEKCLCTFKQHKDKVQTVKWHPVEETVLLTAAFDKRVILTDIRSPKGMRIGKLPSDAECSIWNHNQPSVCMIGCEDGQIVSFDIRKISDGEKKRSPCVLWEISAHESAATSISNSAVNGMLVSCSLDETSKIWNIDKLVNEAPQLIYEKPLKAGPLLCCSNVSGLSTTFAFGGDCVVIWDVEETPLVADAFGLS